MAQAINLQITPSNVMPKIYASQFDIGREIEISLYDGASAYTPPVGTDIRFEGKKPDGNGFSYACTYTGNVVTVVTTDQMTVLAGEIPCELRMSLNGDDIGTLNIIFVIEKSPIDENVPISDTEIPAIVELARDEQYTAEAWATGERNGVPVGPTDPQYHNNAKYWAEHAEYGALDDLTDVEITTPADGDILVRNGSAWVNSKALINEIKTRQKYNVKNLLGFFGTITGRTTSTSDNVDLLGKISLKQGDKIVFTCNQNSALTSNTRNTLLILTPSNTKIYEDDGTIANHHNEAGLHIIRYTAPEDGVYSFYMWTHTLSSAITYSQFMVCSDYDYSIDSLYTEPAPTNRDCMSYAVNTKLGVHNFLKNTATTQTINDITFTVNDDGSVTANGTASANTNLLLMGWTNKAFPEGQLVISDDIADHTGAYVYVEAKKGSGTVSTIANTKNHPDLNINYATYDTFYVAIWVTSGTVLSNVTFKPMVRLAEDTDPTYAPYAKTNRELTEDIKITTYTRTTDNTGECSIGSDSEYVPIGGSIVGTQNTHTGAISFRTASSDRNTYYAMFYSATSSALNVVANKELTFIVVWVKKA